MGDRGNAVPALDGFRGYAALLVVAYHAWGFAGQPALGAEPIRALLSTGFLAVEFFFVLSGFVLFLPAARLGEFSSRKAYAIRRVARIVPAYYLSLIVGLVCFGLVVPAGHTLGSAVTPASLASHATFTVTVANLVPGYSGNLGFGVNPPVWTLSVEAFFYVLLPLVAVRYARRPLLWLAGAVAVAVCSRVLITNGVLTQDRNTHDALLSTPPVFFTDFAAGMAAAWVYARRRPRPGGWPARAAPVVALAALASLLVLMVGHGGPDLSAVRLHLRNATLAITAIPLVFAIVVLATALSPPWFQWPVANRLARWLGEISYGVYLFHFMIFGFLVNTLGFPRDSSHAALAALAGVGVPAALAAGWLSYRWVEHPARRWARRSLAARSLSS